MLWASLAGRVAVAGTASEQRTGGRALTQPDMTARSQFNWSGTYRYAFDTIMAPRSLGELQELVAGADQVKVIGSRHSFTGITDGSRAISVTSLPAAIEVSGDRKTVTVPAGVTYGTLASQLHAEGLALANLASLPHISVAGAVATATHGSGRNNGNLATAVTGIQLVLANGELVELAAGEDWFDGAVVHLGALGVVRALTLKVEPEFEVLQRVYQDLSWDVIIENFEQLMAAAYSVSVFTDRTQRAAQVWLKQRSDWPEPPDVLFGVRTATRDLHPLPGLDPANCTKQMGVPGLWSDRLPHFRMEFTPSNGEEIQSEFHIAAEHGPDAIHALLPLRDKLSHILQDWEIRAIKADSLWLSPEYHRDSVAFHMTWDPDVAGVNAAIRLVEDALAPFDPRPHWGKVFTPTQAPVASRYERYADFVCLQKKFDPGGKFVNDWVRVNLLGQ
jgi:xylitol oxidase